MKLKDLPISSQVFEDVRDSDALYIDKTAYLHRMVLVGRKQEGSKGICPKFFLSRPRRFGKSMTISTLKALFEGKKELFKGLFIGNTDYGFETHPILKLDFSSLGKTPGDLKHSLESRLDDIAKRGGIDLTGQTLISEKTERILTSMEQKWVILIDEYDAPILDALKEADDGIRSERCKEIINVLREFYLTVKANDANLRLVFITGVSKFSQVSVFSGLNNLQDMTMDADYAGLCGYTQEELESDFWPYITRLAESQNLTVPATLEKLKYFYNGYRFSKQSNLRVYNPFSVLNAFQSKEFDTKWFQSGTPSFLVEWISRQKNPVGSFEGKSVEMEIFDAQEPHQMELLGMMIQTGYLTISKYDQKTNRYFLDYPNYEVKKGFMDGLLKYFEKMPLSDLTDYLDEWKISVSSGDWQGFFEGFNELLASVPYYIQMPTEAYYHSVFHCVIALLGLRIQSEVATSRGRIDTFIETEEAYWVFEFKAAKEASDYDKKLEEASQQIIKRGYVHRFTSFPTDKPVQVMGVVFDTHLKQVVKWATVA